MPSRATVMLVAFMISYLMSLDKCLFEYGARPEAKASQGKVLDPLQTTLARRSASAAAATAFATAKAPRHVVSKKTAYMIFCKLFLYLVQIFNLQWLVAVSGSPSLLESFDS